MRRSEVNKLVVAAQACFRAHGWALPPVPRWDVADPRVGRQPSIIEDEPASVRLLWEGPAAG